MTVQQRHTGKGSATFSLCRPVAGWLWGAALLLAAYCAQAQPRLQVGKNVVVSSDMPGHPHVEPFLAADPVDPKHLVAGTIAFTRLDGNFTCAVFTSFDGGQTWSRSPVPGLEQFRFAGDPWVAFGTDSSIYFSCLGDRPKDNTTVVLRSTDGGRSWREPIIVPHEPGKTVDHPAIVVDTTTGPRKGTLYVVSTQVSSAPPLQLLVSLSLARSVDQGRSFQPPIILTPSGLNLNIGNPVILSDGTLVFPFFDFMGSRGWLQHPRLWVVRSTDGGKSLSFPYFVTEQADAFFPSLAVDPVSVARPQQLHLVWARAQWPPRGIFLSSSSDGGITWSAPLRVDHIPGDYPGVRIAAIAVNREGVIGVAWYDNRNADGGLCWDIYFTASFDRGKTFVSEVRVSEKTFCPVTEKNVSKLAEGGVFGVGRRWPAGGDYSGLAAAPDGRFHVLWADSRSGIYQIYTAVVEALPATAPDSGSPKRAHGERR